MKEKSRFAVKFVEIGFTTGMDVLYNLKNIAIEPSFY